MSQIVTATFENGLLKPDTPLELPAQARVRLTVELLRPSPVPVQDPLEELEQLCDSFPINSKGNLLTRDELHERR